MTSERPHRYFFIHMMKTAGSAFRKRLRNHFGDAAVYPTRGLDGTDPVKLNLSIAHLRGRLAVRGDQIEVITGHFPLRTVEQLDGRFTTLTLLRDPVERMLSYLRQQRQNPGADRSRSLEEMYGDLEGRSDNNMTKMLALTPEAMKASLLGKVGLGREDVERAKEALARIDAVGLQEHYEEFCDRVSARFGWALGAPEVVHPTRSAEVPEALRARIAEDNAFDAELYELAKRFAADPVGAQR